MIANAITKSGTNVYSGGIGGYFRDAKLNAADKVQNVVLPYQNQQVSTTFGGPLIRTASISLATTSTSVSRRCSSSRPPAGSRRST